jgi:hypothetical protein
MLLTLVFRAVGPLPKGCSLVPYRPRKLGNRRAPADSVQNPNASLGFAMPASTWCRRGARGQTRTLTALVKKYRSRAEMQRKAERNLGPVNAP